MESMSTILFLDLKLAICREARILRHELTNFEFEAQIWATVRDRCSLQDTRQRALVGHRQGEGNDFVFRFCGIRKSGWFNIFLPRLLLDLYRDAVCGGIRRETSFPQRLVGISLRNSTKQRDFVMPWALQIFLGGWFGSRSAKDTVRSPCGDSM